MDRDTEVKDKRLRKEIMEHLGGGDDVSIPIIQRTFKTGYFAASRAFHKLVSDGFIIPSENIHGVSKIK